MPGVRAIIDRLSDRKEMSVEEFVDDCLELMGPLKAEDDTRQELINHARASGDVRCGTTEEEYQTFGQRVAQMLQLIAATREYQFC